MAVAGKMVRQLPGIGDEYKEYIRWIHGVPTPEAAAPSQPRAVAGPSHSSETKTGAASSVPVAGVRRPASSPQNSAQRSAKRAKTSIKAEVIDLT